MASDKIEYSRMVIKRTAQTGEVPTIPPVTAVTLNQMIPTDLFVGEFFLNETDDLLWIRTENGILPISLSGSTGSTPTLTQVLFEGNATNGYNIVVSSGDTIVFDGLNTGSTSTILGLDSSGNTITTSFAGTQDLQSVLTEGNTTGLNNIVVSSGATIQYEYLPTGATTQFLAIDADGFTVKTSGGADGTSGTSGINGTDGTSGTSGIGTNGTSGTSGISGGDSLWTSGSSVGSLTSVVGSNVNVNNYSLVAGSGNTLTNSDGSVILSRNNNVVNSVDSLIGGNQNNVTGVTLGSNIVWGYQNTLSATNIFCAAVFGRSNTAYRPYSITSGYLNDHYSLYGAMFGYNNKSLNLNNYTLVAGAGNTIDGSFGGFVVGVNNYLGGMQSAIIGGTGITGVTDNMVYVPNLTIVSATTGTSVASLGIDSTGKVIKTSGGTSTTNTGTHFNSSLIAGYEYSLAITSNPQQIGIYSGAIVISPFTPGRNISISALTADIFSTAAGAEMKLVAYSNDPTRLGPGSIIIESPVFDLSVNPFTIRQYNVNYTFQAGTTYWLGIAANSAASGVQMRGMNISSTFAFGVPSVSGSGWIYNMCYSTISAWPSLPTPSSISPNWAPLPEVRIKVAS